MAKAVRTRRAIASVAVVSLALTAAAASGAGGADEAPPPLVPAPTEEMRYQMAAAEAEREAASARRATPEAREQRLRSRSAYRGLGRTEALALAKDTFSQIFESPAFVPYSPPPGLRVARLIGTEGALLDGATADENLLVESVGIPFSSAIGSGERELLDFELRRDGQGFEPRNPAVETHVSDGGAARVGAVGIQVTGMEAPEPAAQANERLFYANGLLDTDVSVTPMPVGLEFAFQVRSAQAPQQASLEVTAPGAVSLSTTPEGVEVAVDGKLAGRFVPPVAWDADGQPVTVAYATEGSRLNLSFPHRAKDVHYPLYVDPLYESFGQGFSRAWDEWGEESSNWSLWTSSPNTDGRNWVQNRAGNWFWSTEYARRIWQNPRGYIKSLSWYQVGHTPQVTCANAGIMNAAKNGWKGTPWSECRAFDFSGWLNPYSETTDGSYGDHAALGMYMNGNGQRANYATLMAYGAYIGLDDGEHPTITGVTNSTNGAWVGPGADVTVRPSAQDAGLGMRAFNLYAADNPVSWVRSNGEPGSELSACKGMRGYRCPNDRAVTGALTVNTNDLKDGSGRHLEGELVFSGQAFDVLSKPSGYSTQIKVDRTAPTPTPSGALWDAHGSSIMGESYPLQVVATDAGAGVKRIDILVDDVLVPAQGDQPCPAGGCSVTRNWTFRPRDFGVGKHTITVRVFDHLNQFDWRTIEVVWIPCP